MRLRFDERELALLHGSEQVRGAAYAGAPRPDLLRTALSLARLGHKVTRVAPGAQLTLDEAEVGLLVDAVRFALGEVQWATHTRDDEATEKPRRVAVNVGFPELVEKGAWRSFGLTRELDALAQKLRAALTA